MRIKLRLLPILVCVILTASMTLTYAMTATAAGVLPQNYTSINLLYNKAVAEKNNANIVLHGQKIIDLFNTMPDNKQKLDIVVPRLLNIAKAHEVLGKTNKQNYSLAAESYVNYAEMLEKQRMLNPKYDKAALNNDVRYQLYSNAGRIYYDLLKDYDKALAVYDLVLKYDPENSGVTTKYFELAKIYETQGKFDESLKLFAKYIPRAEKLGWKDGVNYARTKLNVLNFELELYTKSPDLNLSKYFGAKYEPKSGVYFGSTYDADPRISAFNWNKISTYFPKKNSTYLTYLHWGEEAKSFERYYIDAKNNNIALEIAWNIEDSSISSILKNIENHKAYIDRTAKYFGELNIPIFLRFAGEMNIKQNSNDSAAFVKAYRYVADSIRSNAPNVAMVWSPNDVSASGRTFQEYYPGDEYVDWVGISSYTSKYFQGKKNWGAMQESNDTVYMTGDYANPLAKIKPLLDLYGGKKPFMLAETGVGHYAKLEREDLTSWAEVQLKRLYIYGPMIYPQLKGIHYFNVNNDLVAKNDNFALYANDKINTLYNDMVGSENYVSNVGSSAAFTYVKITSNTINSLSIPISTYTIVPKVLKPTIQYIIDNNLFATKTELPYEIQLDAVKLSKGDHLLTVEVYDGGKKLRSKDYSVLVSQNSVTIKAK